MMDITWGDTVRITTSADIKNRQGSLGEVCGIAEVVTEKHARVVGCSVGTTVYLIEFSDGVSVEAPGEWLEKVTVS